jgi:PTH1 family peptidyl-tRNA hydrolase
MQLIVGLGNAAPEYNSTRHNFGFRAVDALVLSRNMSYQPGKGDYLIAIHEADHFAVVKSVGFMNESGWAVFDAMDFVKAEAKDILVVYDDIDLPLGALRFRPSGGAGGHKGMESIIATLGSEDFHRLRLGIATDAPMKPSERYVLDPFREQDLPLVAETVTTAVKGLEIYMERNIDVAMAKFNSGPEESETKESITSE